MTDREREGLIRAKYKNGNPQCEGVFLLRCIDEVNAARQHDMDSIKRQLQELIIYTDAPIYEGD